MGGISEATRAIVLFDFTHEYWPRSAESIGYGDVISSSLPSAAAAAYFLSNEHHRMSSLV